MSQSSILTRLKKITIEDAYISVPITDDLFDCHPDKDGNYHLDMEAFWKKAIDLSSDPSIEWKLEEITVNPHDIQKPIPSDRKSFIPTGNNKL